ncbi:MAG: hypothetical protein QNJ63_24710 [Calothrix sp. MO_192.B10]|nr:hypothetical protein [Calothrix sp. MO_192.B10]
MLKLTYTEDSFHLEYLTQSPEEWVAQRVILAMRSGQFLCVKPSHASFLLPADLPGLEQLRQLIHTEDSGIISLCHCDRDYVEVTLSGSWLAEDTEEATGIFVTSISDVSDGVTETTPTLQSAEATEYPSTSHTELLLYNLWLAAQNCASVIRE